MKHDSTQRGVLIVPEPETLEWDGTTYPFDGFRGFPPSIARKFGVPSGSWAITRNEAEGSGLEVRNGEVVIWGEESVCLASVVQLLRQFSGCLPAVRIREAVSFGFRGYHLDIARGAVPLPATFRRILRLLFLLKYNVFAVYLEDLFPWERHPRIGAHRGRLDREELSEVIRFGADLGIQVIPSLNLAGHMEHVICLPEYWPYGEWYRPKEGCLDLSSEKARDLAYDLLEEVLELWPGEYVHIGGDETWSTGRGKSLDADWSFRGPELYEAHHGRLIELVRAKGREPILWGDMISGTMHMGDLMSRAMRERWAELLDRDTWHDCTVANWDYSGRPVEHFRAIIGMFKSRGLRQLACPALSAGERCFPVFASTLANVRSFFEAARIEGIEGYLVTKWGDVGSECLSSLIEPLIAAAAELAVGAESWEAKWRMLSGESEEVLGARQVIGSEEVGGRVKHALFRNAQYSSWDEERRSELLRTWREALEEVGSLPLPEELDFSRRLVEAAVRVLEERISVSDYIALSRLYSRLWLAERKPEGLDVVVSRFWAAAGRQDAGLLHDSRGWWSIV